MSGGVNYIIYKYDGGWIQRKKIRFGQNKGVPTIR